MLLKSAPKVTLRANPPFSGSGQMSVGKIGLVNWGWLSIQQSENKIKLFKKPYILLTVNLYTFEGCQSTKKAVYGEATK